jgi:hypothetical protein
MPSLLERADLAGGQDGSGWVLYRIVRADAEESTRMSIRKSS